MVKFCGYVNNISDYIIIYYIYTLYIIISGYINNIRFQSVKNISDLPFSLLTNVFET